MDTERSQARNIEVETELFRLNTILFNLKRQNYYERLGVSPNATFREIADKYRTLAKTFHPDKMSEFLEDSKILEVRNWIYSLISEAGQTLRDAKKRSAYDKILTSDFTVSFDVIRITKELLAAHYVGRDIFLQKLAEFTSNGINREIIVAGFKPVVVNLIMFDTKRFSTAEQFVDAVDFWTNNRFITSEEIAQMPEVVKFIEGNIAFFCRECLDSETEYKQIIRRVKYWLDSRFIQRDGVFKIRAYRDYVRREARRQQRKSYDLESQFLNDLYSENIKPGFLDSPDPLSREEQKASEILSTAIKSGEGDLIKEARKIIKDRLISREAMSDLPCIREFVKKRINVFVEVGYESQRILLELYFFINDSWATKGLLLDFFEEEKKRVPSQTKKIAIIDSVLKALREWKSLKPEDLSKLAYG